MRIVQIEREKYEEVWGSCALYGETSPGEGAVKAFLAMSKTTMGGSVLDAGCGSGKGAIALQAAGFYPTLCDLTEAGLVEEAKGFPFHNVCLWDNLKRRVGFYDWVYCTDVMEHLPTEWVMLTIVRLLEVARRGVFFSITFLPDNMGALVGTQLHQTVKPFTWWKSRLQEVGELVEARDLLNSGVFLIKPRLP